MSGGLAALLDDIALIARSAASSIDDVSASAGRVATKAAGVVVDDAAVTPRYVTGVSPARELPIIWRIAKGSLINKLVIILPIALLLTAFASWLLSPILMVGGMYLTYEGAEKVWERFHGGHHKQAATEAGQQSEDALVKSAVLTDLILSTEIMVISLNEVLGQPLLKQALTLILVGIALTALVYGSVAILVKIDDIGLKLGGSFGSALVKAMPKILSVIAIIGVIAMLWVGGHILIQGAADLGWHTPHGIVHRLVDVVPSALSWVTETACSLVVGLIIGTVVVGLFHGIQKLR